VAVSRGAECHELRHEVNIDKQERWVTILGRSLSSFACSYSVSMLRAERKKSVGCEISKSDDRDIARIAKRCVLHGSTHIKPTPRSKGVKEVDAPLLHRCIVEHAIEFRTRHHDRMEPMSSSSAATANVGRWDEGQGTRFRKKRRGGEDKKD